MKKFGLNLDFDAIRERIEIDKSHYKPGIWAGMVGVSGNVVSNIHGKTKQNPSLEYIIAVALSTGKSVDYYLWGSESEPSHETEDSNGGDSIIIEHQDIIKRFKDPELGKDINEQLVVIQDNSGIYKGIVSSIKAAFDTVMAIKDAQSGNYSAPSAGSNGTMNSQRKQKLPKGAKKNGTSG